MIVDDKYLAILLTMSNAVPPLNWLPPLLVVVAVLLRTTLVHRRGPLWVLSALVAIVAGMCATLTFLHTERSLGQIIAWSCAVLSFVAAWIASMAMCHNYAFRSKLNEPSAFVDVAHLVSLLSAVVAIVIGAYVLGVRAIACLMDILSSVPRATETSYGFGVDGLWSLFFVLLAILCAERSTRATILRTWALIISAMMVTWFALLWRPIELSPHSGLVRTNGPVILVGVLAALTLGAVVIQGAVVQRYRWHLAMTSPDDLATPSPPWPGYRKVCGGLVVITLLLLANHLVVPVLLTGNHNTTVAVVLAVSACAAGYASLILTMRQWHPNFADAGLGLMSFGICCALFTFLPGRSVALADHYPIIFNVLMVGFGIGTWLWTWLSLVWQQQLDNGKPWTTEGQLIRHAKRVAFLCAVLATTSGGMMAIWPYLRIVGTSDASLGRITAGLGGNLFLLLIFLWTARRLRRHTFHMLSMLALVSTAGFMLLRMLPFSEYAR